ncbi:MAG: hypothetical protein FJ224_12070 [Lentisphaerae bacterium]|nr:hypothetical protein [Lentisphaerota bacterium]
MASPKRGFEEIQSLYIYDGWAMISEVRSQRAEVSTNSYIYGLDLSGTLPGLPRLGVGAAGVGGLLCSSRTQGDSDFLVFHTYDASGNVCDLFQVSSLMRAYSRDDPGAAGHDRVHIDSPMTRRTPRETSAGRRRERPAWHNTLPWMELTQICQVGDMWHG